MTCGCCSEPAEGARTDFQYAVKIVCGPMAKGSSSPLPPGKYFTKVNVHNFSRCDCVTFRWKVAIGNPQLRVGPISDFATATLCADEALEIDNTDIVRQLATTQGKSLAKSQHLEGWVVIESPTELDIVAVYAASQTAEGAIATFHTERVCPRRLVVCEDFYADISTGVAAWDVKAPGATSFEEPVLGSATPEWAAAPAGSIWIRPSVNTSQSAAGDYTFRLPFKLCSGFSDPQLSVMLLADNLASVFLNGVQVATAQTSGSNYTSPITFSVNSGFKAGDNELTIVVRNKATGHVGLALLGSIRAVAGLCPGTQPVETLPCPIVRYELYTRRVWFNPLIGMFIGIGPRWDSSSGQASTVGEIAGERRAEVLRASLTGPVNPGTTIEYNVFTRNLAGGLKGWFKSWTSSWVSSGDCGHMGVDRAMTAVAIKLVNAPVNCHIRYRIKPRRSLIHLWLPLDWSPWYYDGAVAGTVTTNGFPPDSQPITAIQVEIV